MRQHSLRWSLEFRPEIDFCVWALRYDGLHVDPFNDHEPGNGELQAAGLTASSWRAWLERMVGIFESIDRTLARADSAEREDDPEFDQLARLLDDPAELVDGPADLRHKLRELWAEYQADRSSRNGKAAALVDAGEALMRQVPRARINELLLYVVDYPRPVVLPLSGRAVVAGRGRDTATFVNAIAEAAVSSVWPR